jgi:hypothetical protein
MNTVNEQEVCVETPITVSGSETPRQMTPEEQRIAIAVACGWKQQDKIFNWLPPEGFVGKNGGIRQSHKCLPDYLNDLNAMHEAEKVLTTDQSVAYRICLMSNSDGRRAVFPTLEAALCHATAAQRCEAFLKTLGLWKKDL